MGRRWWGAGVVVGALLVALVAANISGSRLAGTPSAILAAPIPMVGQCLLADPGTDRSAVDQPNAEVRAGSFGPCADNNFGEVVWVKDAGTMQGGPTQRLAALVPLDCWQPASHYLNAPEVAHNNDPPVDEPPNWSPAAMQSLVRFGPDRAQYTAGQTWIACVILPRDAPYPGSVRGSPAGPAANAYGSCRAVDQEPYVPCAQVHDSEVFGFAPVGPSDVPEMLASCRSLIATVTGLGDVNAGGRLSLWVETGGSFSSTQQFADTAAIADGMCTLTTTVGTRLVASLIGVGSGPLPLG